MAIKLWTVDFMRICAANLLLFISLYILFPVLSLEMADRFDIPVAQTSVIFLFFTIGMFLVGPFHAYLVDAYKRKYVCIFSMLTMIASTIGYAFVANMTELILLSTIQGVSFGMATTAGITLAIDITNSNLRSAGNTGFSWMARLGMIIGIALGIWMYQNYGFRNLLDASVIAGSAGILIISGVYVPFRAPIVVKLYSFDRFLLLRSWIPAVNMILAAFVFGLLISLVHPFHNETIHNIGGVNIIFFAGVGVGFVVSLVLSRLLQLLFQHLVYKEISMRVIIAGLSLEMIAFSLLNMNISTIAASVILGCGMGLVIPAFLIIFVKLSQHCQRGTANTTHLLANETGIVLGIAVACNMNAETVFYTGQIMSSIALLFFVLIAYPYYKKMKVR